MKNQFIINPSEDVMFDAEKIYGVKHGIIQVGVEDLKAVIDKAENVILLEGKANGRHRTANAIEDAVLHTSSVAREYDLFTADKVLLLIIYSKIYPMLLAEAADITQFADMFPTNTSFIWGVSEDENNEDYLTVRIVASNLKKIGLY